ncbi:hypothetical protein ACK81Y_001176 [Salmonella enterica]|uniref:hypothetical protein n=1 Tax=Salmonella enterica TaxID=28901 RepID=UPI0032049481
MVQILRRYPFPVLEHLWRFPATVLIKIVEDVASFQELLPVMAHCLKGDTGL